MKTQNPYKLKDKFSWGAVFVIFIGLLMVYAGVGTMEAGKVSDITGIFISGLGLFFAMLGGILLKINEEN